MVRSFIKITGPPLLKGLRALESIAVEMSTKTVMRFYNVSIPKIHSQAWDQSLTVPTVLTRSPYEVTLLPNYPDMEPEEKVKLVSEAAQVLGDYDFFFEWGVEPTVSQVNELIELIDKAFAECGCQYTITTK